MIDNIDRVESANEHHIINHSHSRGDELLGNLTAVSEFVLLREVVIIFEMWNLGLWMT